MTGAPFEALLNACGGARYDILPDDVRGMTFDDAVVMFFADDMRIIASRAPAGVFEPGGRMFDYLPGFSRELWLDAPAGDAVFGFLRVAIAEKSETAQRLGIGDTAFVRSFAGLPEVMLAVFAVSRCGESRDEASDGAEAECIPAFPPSLAAADELFRRAADVPAGTSGASFFCSAAELASDAARLCGCGIAVTDMTEPYISAAGYDSVGALALTLIAAMLFRRVGRRRGFNLSIRMIDDEPHTPCFCIDAELYAGRRRASVTEFPELAALAGIARGRMIDCDFCCHGKLRSGRLQLSFAPGRCLTGQPALKAPAFGGNDAVRADLLSLGRQGRTVY